MVLSAISLWISGYKLSLRGAEARGEPRRAKRPTTFQIFTRYQICKLCIFCMTYLYKRYLGTPLA